VVWAAWCNTSLATWTQNLKEPGFTSFRYRVDGWVFGDPAPALVDLEPGMAVPRDGVVAIDHDTATGSCDAVYVAEQGHWVPLERTNGVRRLGGTLALDGPTTAVAGGDTWTLWAEIDAATLRFVVEVDGVATTGSSVDLAGAGAGTSLARITIVADPVIGELSVTVGGELALFSFAVPPGPMVPFAAFTLDAGAGDSLCRQLLARR
jgi:hypothetical protein